MTSSAAAQPTRDWVFDDAARARVDAIFAPWATTSTPGMSLGIYRAGEIVYTNGYGMSNLEHGIPIVPGSIFHIASISKQFTDMSIALLQAEGALNVDDDVRQYVPEMPDFGTTITIRHLIHHVSGLRDQWALLRMAGWRSEDLVTEDDVLDLLTRQTALNFAPNSEYLYSNTGYTLLAVIVRRVSGKTLRQFAHERIFAPLGMTSTHFHDDHREIVVGRTQAYEPRTGGGYHVSIPVFDVVGTTSLFTTVEDLAKWDANFTTAQIGGPAIIEQIQTPGTFTDGTAMTYAWGLMTGEYRGAKRVGHSGADHGYRADYLRLPEFGFTAVVLSNIADSNPGLLTQRVVDAVLGDHLAPATTFAVPTAASASAGIPPIVSATALAGTYRAADGASYATITSRDGVASLESWESLTLNVIGNGRFVADAAVGPAIRIEATSVQEDGLVGEIAVVTPGEPTATYTRVDLPTRDADALAAYAGEYWSDELGVAYEIVADRVAGTLLVRRRKFADQTLTPLDADVFGRGSLAFGTIVTFARDASGTVTGFRYTAGRIRNLVFTKR